MFLHQRNMFIHPQKFFCNSWEYIDAVTLQLTGKAKLRWTGDNSIGTVYRNIVKVYYNQKGQDARLPLAKATQEGKWFGVIKRLAPKMGCLWKIFDAESSHQSSPHRTDLKKTPGMACFILFLARIPQCPTPSRYRSVGPMADGINPSRHGSVGPMADSIFRLSTSWSKEERVDDELRAQWRIINVCF